MSLLKLMQQKYILAPSSSQDCPMSEGYGFISNSYTGDSFQKEDAWLNKLSSFQICFCEALATSPCVHGFCIRASALP